MADGSLTHFLAIDFSGSTAISHGQDRPESQDFELNQTNAAGAKITKMTSLLPLLQRQTQAVRLISAS